jgi:hypothetical protein
MMEIAQNKRWSFCVSPGRVVTVGFPRCARDREKNQPENWSPAEPQLFRRSVYALRRGRMLKSRTWASRLERCIESSLSRH